jgi:dolichol-phosphate mannosyltransferase
MKTLVVVPTYNESLNIEKIVSKILDCNPQVDILVVDDNSPDGTGQIADRLAAADSRVRVLHRTEKSGLGGAYLAGFAKGFEWGYDYLVEMDADGSHRPEDLPKLLARAALSDLVIGSRWVRGGKVVNWPLRRQILSRGGNLYVRLALGTKVHDMTAGFRCFDAKFLQGLDLATVNSKGYSFQIEMALRSLRAGGRVVEVPITFVERELGESKMSGAIVKEAMTLVTKQGINRILGRNR